jgi:dTMP kinase
MGGVSPQPSTPPEWNRLDARDLEYHHRVAEGFRELMKRDPERWLKLDAYQSVDQIAETIKQSVTPLLSRILPLEQQ